MTSWRSVVALRGADAGSGAAAQINADLVAEVTRQAVAAYRGPFSAGSKRGSVNR